MHVLTVLTSMMVIKKNAYNTYGKSYSPVNCCLQETVYMDCSSVVCHTVGKYNDVDKQGSQRWQTLARNNAPVT